MIDIPYRRLATIIFACCSLMLCAQQNGEKTDKANRKEVKSIYFNPDSTGFVLGNINPVSFAGRGFMVSPSPFGTITIISGQQNLIHGQACIISPGAGGNIRGGTKYGRLVVDTVSSNILNVVNDTIEYGFANVGDDEDNSIYTNMFTAKKRVNDFTDIQRFCARYYDTLPMRNRSYMEMIHFVGLSKGTLANNVFINNDKVQINWHQTQIGYTGGDTLSGQHWEFGSKGMVQYGSMGKVKASIDTAGQLIVQSQLLLGPLRYYNTDSTNIYSISKPQPGDTYFCTDCTARDNSIGVKVCYNGKLWKREW